MFCELKVLNHNNLQCLLLWETQLPFGVDTLQRGVGGAKKKKRKITSREKFSLQSPQTVPMFTAPLC